MRNIKKLLCWAMVLALIATGSGLAALAETLALPGALTVIGEEASLI